MKNIAVLFFLVCTTSWCQFEIKQNFSDAIDSGIACVDVTSGVLFNTKIYRSFDLEEDVPFNGNTYVNTAYFSIEELTEPIEIAIALYASVGEFPNSTLELRGAAIYQATPADTFTVISVPIEAEFNLSFEDSIVYELSVLGNGTKIFNFGSNLEGQSAPSYIQADDCSVFEPTDLESLSVLDAIVMYLEANGEFIGFEDETLKTFSIYPNPVENKLKINTNALLDNLIIYSIDGQVALEKAGIDEIDVSSLPSGIYFIQVTSENLIHTNKFIKK